MKSSSWTKAESWSADRTTISRVRVASIQGCTRPGLPNSAGLEDSAGLHDRDAEQDHTQRAREADSCPDAFEGRVLDEGVQSGTDAGNDDERQLDHQGLLVCVAAVASTREHPAARQDEHNERRPGHPG